MSDLAYTIKSDVESAGFTPYGGVKEFIYCKDFEVIAEGPAETGKTLGACWKIHAQASKYSGARIALLRKRQTDVYTSVYETLKQVIDGLPIRAYGGEKPEKLMYPNGSTIYIGGLDKPSKVLSSERDIIYVNQCEEASMKDWEYLATRVTGRGSVMPYTQLSGDCNPGPPTHWIKTREKQGGLRLIKTFHKDNPTLYNRDGTITEQGRRTLGVLNSLTGSRKLRLKDGLWAAPEGAIYDVFDDEKHKVKAIEIPHTWPKAVGVDPLGVYTAAVWGALDAKRGILNIYREYYEPFGVTTTQHVKNVLNISRNETIFGWYGGGPSERQARADWEGAGVPLQAPLITDVWSGIDKVYELLSDFAMVIHDTCPMLLSEVGTYRRKMKDGIPTDTIENKDQFHLLDALRYLIAGLVGPRETTEVGYSPIKIGRW
jgi:phage terminase large subunit